MVFLPNYDSVSFIFIVVGHGVPPCVEIMDISALCSFSVTGSLCRCPCGSAPGSWLLALTPIVLQLTATPVLIQLQGLRTGGCLQVGSLSQVPLSPHNELTTFLGWRDQLILETKWRFLVHFFFSFIFCNVLTWSKGNLEAPRKPLVPNHVARTYGSFFLGLVLVFLEPFKRKLMLWL